MAWFALGCAVTAVVAANYLLKLGREDVRRGFGPPQIELIRFGSGAPKVWRSGEFLGPDDQIHVSVVAGNQSLVAYAGMIGDEDQYVSDPDTLFSRILSLKPGEHGEIPAVFAAAYPSHKLAIVVALCEGDWGNVPLAEAIEELQGAMAVAARGEQPKALPSSLYCDFRSFRLR